MAMLEKFQKKLSTVHTLTSQYDEEMEDRVKERSGEEGELDSEEGDDGWSVVYTCSLVYCIVMLGFYCAT